VSSPVARRPYDLRHACLSTWRNAGVPPAQVAEWAGHSVNVLLRVYAKSIDGQDELASNASRPRSAPCKSVSECGAALLVPELPDSEAAPSEPAGTRVGAGLCPGTSFHISSRHPQTPGSGRTQPDHDEGPPTSKRRGQRPFSVGGRCRIRTCVGIRRRIYRPEDAHALTSMLVPASGNYGSISPRSRPAVRRQNPGHRSITICGLSSDPRRR